MNAILFFTPSLAQTQYQWKQPAFSGKQNPTVTARRRIVAANYDKRLTIDQNLRAMRRILKTQLHIMGYNRTTLVKDLYVIHHEARPRIKKLTPHPKATAAEMEKRLTDVKRVYNPDLPYRVMADSIGISRDAFKTAVNKIRKQPNHPKVFDTPRSFDQAV